MADTGDILLYRTRGVAAKMTRALSHSKYDHVALILKFEPELDETFLLDATS